MEEIDRDTLFDFHGVSMSKTFTDNWDEVQNFQARPEDILIATYPKAGTTWVCYMLDLLYFGRMGPQRETSIPIHKRVPFLEITKPSQPTGKDLADQLPTTPRLIKTHLPPQFVPKSFWEQNVRIINVFRNAKDSAVSYYHFCRMSKGMPEPGDWSTFLQNFMEGKVVYGSWHDHVKGWWEKKLTYPNIHHVFYEDLIQDTGREFDKLCCFLGLSCSAEEKERVTTGVRFDNMKQNQMVNYSTVQSLNQKLSPFMRKGKVGDWRNHFTVVQEEKFDEDYTRKMKNTTLQFRSDV
ncbi:cytosolic sulfotransferase 3-like isoform X1 [Pungitius pungitius]|uniref:cytosolic sulfotransferase 3-like isoform X1 n=1 Tax=Pungitius pungitius TaxID=134920 RepID=UPI002E148ACA